MSQFWWEVIDGIAIGFVGLPAALSLIAALFVLRDRWVQ